MNNLILLTFEKLCLLEMYKFKTFKTYKKKVKILSNFNTIFIKSKFE